MGAHACDPTTAAWITPGLRLGNPARPPAPSRPVAGPASGGPGPAGRAARRPPRTRSSCPSRTWIWPGRPLRWPSRTLRPPAMRKPHRPAVGPGLRARRVPRPHRLSRTRPPGPGPPGPGPPGPGQSGRSPPGPGQRGSRQATAAAPGAIRHGTRVLRHPARAGAGHRTASRAVLGRGAGHHRPAVGSAATAPPVGPPDRYRPRRRAPRGHRVWPRCRVPPGGRLPAQHPLAPDAGPRRGRSPVRRGGRHGRADPRRGLRHGEWQPGAGGHRPAGQRGRAPGRRGSPGAGRGVDYVAGRHGHDRGLRSVDVRGPAARRPVRRAAPRARHRERLARRAAT